MIHIGFEINRENIYVLKIDSGITSNHYTQGIVVGDYFATFNIRSNNVYRSGCICEGYSIRKKYWHEIMYNNK